MKYEDIFLKTEGDNYYKRNKGTSFAIDHDVPLKLLDIYGIKPRHVAEIGAANGARLHEMKKIYGDDLYTVGVEPGQKAVDDGNAMYPNINLKNGVVSHLPIEEKFDLVIVNFVMHWIERDELFKSLSELNRILDDGGYLIIGDFYPDYPQKRRYHHVEEDVFTWKMMYNQLMTSTALYREVAFLSYDRDDKCKLVPDVDPINRGFASLLRKSSSDFYHEK